MQSENSSDNIMFLSTVVQLVKIVDNIVVYHLRTPSVLRLEQ